MVNPTLGAAFTRALEAGRNLGPRGMPVTLERATQVFQDGRVEVLGVRIPVTGSGARGLRAGEMVAVSWQRGQPVVAIRHSARRTGPVSPSPRPVLPLVEELFIATRPDGIRDVYFRNYDAVTALRLDRFVSTASILNVRWGTLNNRFFVQASLFGPRIYYIFTLDREPDTPFAASDDPSRAVALERVENLTTNTTPVATLSAINQTPASVTLTPANPTSNLIPSGGTSASLSDHDWRLDPDGNLIIAYDLAISGVRMVPANFPAAIYANSPFSTIGADLHYAIIVDLTRGVKLLDLFENNSLLSEWPPIPDYNSLDIEGIGLLVPVSWTAANSFTRTVVGPGFPPEGGTLTITWHCGRTSPETPHVYEYRLLPFLVREPGAGRRVLGFVARVEFTYPAFAVQTFSEPLWITYITPLPSEFPNCAPVQEPQAGAMLSHPLSETRVALFPIARPAMGLAWFPTWGHLVWRTTTVSSIFPGDYGPGVDSPGFVTAYGDSSVTRITETLRMRFEERGIVFLASDFIYQPDEPPTALPTSAAVNYFVEAWETGGGTVTLDADASDFPVEDSSLSELDALAAIPTGITHPAVTSRAFYINNAEAALSAAGRFYEIPAR